MLRGMQIPSRSSSRKRDYGRLGMTMHAKGASGTADTSHAREGRRFQNLRWPQKKERYLAGERSAPALAGVELVPEKEELDPATEPRRALDRAGVAGPVIMALSGFNRRP